MPYLNDSYVTVLQVEPHDFNSSDPLGEAKEWAENNLVGTYTSHIGKLDQFNYKITNSAIRKYLSPTAIHKSDSIHVHLAILKYFTKIIDKSVETEIHADYIKTKEGRVISSPTNKNILIHRFYGVIKLSDLVYLSSYTTEYFCIKTHFYSAKIAFVSIIRNNLLLFYFKDRLKPISRYLQYLQLIQNAFLAHLPIWEHISSLVIYSKKVSCNCHQQINIPD